MADELKGFNATKAPKRNDPVPSGEYKAMVVDAKKVESKSTKGNFYLAVKFQICEGLHKGRTLFSNINLWNENAVTKNMAQAELGELCLAMGISILNSTDDLKNKPLLIIVVVQERSDIKGQFQNVIKKYAKIAAAAKPAPKNRSPKKKPEPEPELESSEDETEAEVVEEEESEVVEEEEAEVEEDGEEEEDVPPWT